MLMDVTTNGISGFAGGISAILGFGFRTLKTQIAELTPEQLAFTPVGFSNSIATLIVHMYGVEASFAHRLAGKTTPDELKAEYLLNLPQKPLPVVTGATVESLTPKMEKGRALLMEAIGSFREADLEQEIVMGGERTGTVRWVLSLLAHHQSHHIGQILLIKKLLG